LDNACGKNNYKSVYFSPSDYRGKWAVMVREIKRQPKVLDLLQEATVEKKGKNMMEDLEGAEVPLEEYSDEEVT
jgi:hypothetical protein